MSMRGTGNDGVYSLPDQKQIDGSPLSPQKSAISVGNPPDTASSQVKSTPYSKRRKSLHNIISSTPSQPPHITPTLMSLSRSHYLGSTLSLQPREKGPRMSKKSKSVDAKPSKLLSKQIMKDLNDKYRKEVSFRSRVMKSTASFSLVIVLGFSSKQFLPKSFLSRGFSLREVWAINKNALLIAGICSVTYTHCSVDGTPRAGVSGWGDGQSGVSPWSVLQIPLPESISYHYHNLSGFPSLRDMESLHSDRIQQCTYVPISGALPRGTNTKQAIRQPQGNNDLLRPIGDIPHEPAVPISDVHSAPGRQPPRRHRHTLTWGQVILKYIIYPIRNLILSPPITVVHIPYDDDVDVDHHDGGDTGRGAASIQMSYVHPPASPSRISVHNTNQTPQPSTPPSPLVSQPYSNHVPHFTRVQCLSPSESIFTKFYMLQHYYKVKTPRKSICVSESHKKPEVSYPSLDYPSLERIATKPWSVILSPSPSADHKHRTVSHPVTITSHHQVTVRLNKILDLAKDTELFSLPHSLLSFFPTSSLSLGTIIQHKFCSIFQPKDPLAFHPIYRWISFYTFNTTLSSTRLAELSARYRSLVSELSGSSSSLSSRSSSMSEKVDNEKNTTTLSSSVSSSVLSSPSSTTRTETGTERGTTADADGDSPFSYHDFPREVSPAWLRTRYGYKETPLYQLYHSFVTKTLCPSENSTWCRAFCLYQIDAVFHTIWGIHSFATMPPTDFPRAFSFKPHHIRDLVPSFLHNSTAVHYAEQFAANLTDFIFIPPGFDENLALHPHKPLNSSQSPQKLPTSTHLRTNNNTSSPPLPDSNAKIQEDEAIFVSHDAELPHPQTSQTQTAQISPMFILWLTCITIYSINYIFERSALWMSSTSSYSEYIRYKQQEMIYNLDRKRQRQQLTEVLSHLQQEQSNKAKTSRRKSRATRTRQEDNQDGRQPSNVLPDEPEARFKQKSSTPRRRRGPQGQPSLSVANPTSEEIEDQIIYPHRSLSRVDSRGDLRDRLDTVPLDSMNVNAGGMPTQHSIIRHGIDEESFSHTTPRKRIDPRHTPNRTATPIRSPFKPIPAHLRPPKELIESRLPLTLPFPTLSDESISPSSVTTTLRPDDVDGSLAQHNHSTDTLSKVYGQRDFDTTAIPLESYDLTSPTLSSSNSSALSPHTSYFSPPSTLFQSSSFQSVGASHMADSSADERMYSSMEDDHYTLPHTSTLAITDITSSASAASDTTDDGYDDDEEEVTIDDEIVNMSLMPRSYNTIRLNRSLYAHTSGLLPPQGSTPSISSPNPIAVTTKFPTIRPDISSAKSSPPVGLGDGSSLSSSSSSSKQTPPQTFQPLYISRPPNRQEETLYMFTTPHLHTYYGKFSAQYPPFNHPGDSPIFQPMVSWYTITTWDMVQTVVDLAIESKLFAGRYDKRMDFRTTNAYDVYNQTLRESLYMTLLSSVQQQLHAFSLSNNQLLLSQLVYALQLNQITSSPSAMGRHTIGFPPHPSISLQPMASFAPSPGQPSWLHSNGGVGVVGGADLYARSPPASLNASLSSSLLPLNSLVHPGINPSLMPYQHPSAATVQQNVISIDMLIRQLQALNIGQVYHSGATSLAGETVGTPSMASFTSSHLPTPLNSMLSPPEASYRQMFDNNTQHNSNVTTTLGDDRIALLGSTHPQRLQSVSDQYSELVLTHQAMNSINIQQLSCVLACLSFMLSNNNTDTVIFLHKQRDQLNQMLDNIKQLVDVTSAADESDSDSDDAHLFHQMFNNRNAQQPHTSQKLPPLQDQPPSNNVNPSITTGLDGTMSSLQPRLSSTSQFSQSEYVPSNPSGQLSSAFSQYTPQRDHTSTQQSAGMTRAPPPIVTHVAGMPPPHAENIASADPSERDNNSNLVSPSRWSSVPYDPSISAPLKPSTATLSPLASRTFNEPFTSGSTTPQELPVSALQLHVEDDVIPSTQSALHHQPRQVSWLRQSPSQVPQPQHPQTSQHPTQTGSGSTISGSSTSQQNVPHAPISANIVGTGSATPLHRTNQQSADSIPSITTQESSTSTSNLSTLDPSSLITTLETCISAIGQSGVCDGTLFTHFEQYEDEFFFDFTADTGDGGHSTYTVARALAQPYLDIDLPAFPEISPELIESLPSAEAEENGDENNDKPTSPLLQNEDLNLNTQQTTAIQFSDINHLHTTTMIQDLIYNCANQFVMHIYKPCALCALEKSPLQTRKGDAASATDIMHEEGQGGGDDDDDDDDSQNESSERSFPQQQRFPDNADTLADEYVDILPLANVSEMYTDNNEKDSGSAAGDKEPTMRIVSGARTTSLQRSKLLNAERERLQNYFVKQYGTIGNAEKRAMEKIIRTTFEYFKDCPHRSAFSNTEGTYTFLEQQKQSLGDVVQAIQARMQLEVQKAWNQNQFDDNSDNDHDDDLSDEDTSESDEESHFNTGSTNRKLSALERLFVPPDEENDNTHPSQQQLQQPQDIAGAINKGDTNPAHPPRYAGSNTLHNNAHKLASFKIGSSSEQSDIKIRLKRGRLLVIGGDLAYPSPSTKIYEERFVLPFSYALPPPQKLDDKPGGAIQKPLLPRGCRLEDYPGVQMFTIPGNHEYINLDSYIKYFLQKHYLGGWLLPQAKPYSVLKLPHGWWLFNLDIGLSNDIDLAQFQYMAYVADTFVGEYDQVILVQHEPRWLTAHFHGDEEGVNVVKLLNKHLKYKCVMRIGGDIHNYLRHTHVRAYHRDMAATRSQIEDQLRTAAAAAQSGSSSSSLSSSSSDNIVIWFLLSMWYYLIYIPKILTTFVKGFLFGHDPTPTSDILPTAVQEKIALDDQKPDAAPVIVTQTETSKTSDGAPETVVVTPSHDLDRREVEQQELQRGIRQEKESQQQHEVGSQPPSSPDASASHPNEGLNSSSHGNVETSTKTDAETDSNTKRFHQDDNTSDDEDSTSKSSNISTGSQPPGPPTGTALRLSEPQHLLVMGGGGAFCHPTHPFAHDYLYQNNSLYKHVAAYPSISTSLDLTWQNLFKFRRKNWKLDIVSCVVYFVCIISVLPLCNVSDYMFMDPFMSIIQLPGSPIQYSTRTGVQCLKTHSPTESLSSLFDNTSASVPKTVRLASTSIPHAYQASQDKEHQKYNLDITTPFQVGDASQSIRPTYVTSQHRSPLQGTNLSGDHLSHIRQQGSSTLGQHSSPHHHHHMTSPLSTHKSISPSTSLAFLPPIPSASDAPSFHPPEWVYEHWALQYAYLTYVIITRHIDILKSVIISSFVNFGISAIVMLGMLLGTFLFVPSTVDIHKRVFLGFFHGAMHITTAISIAIWLETLLELSTSHGMIGVDSMHTLYEQYQLFEQAHFPDPNGIREYIAMFTLHLYPAGLKWFMTLFDIPNLFAFIRLHLCESCGNFNTISNLSSLGYQFGFLAYYFFLVAPLFSFVLGFWLFVGLRYFNVFFDEGLSSLRIANYKSFCRFRIDSNGTLHCYVLGIDRTPKSFKQDPLWSYSVLHNDKVKRLAAGCLPPGGNESTTDAFSVDYTDPLELSYTHRRPSRWVPESNEPDTLKIIDYFKLPKLHHS